jgi:hypothetical protein
MLDVGTILSAILTIFTFSFLYKENPLYRLCEYLVISCLSAVLIVTAWSNIEKQGYLNLLAGQYIYLFGIVLGLLLYTRFYPKFSYLGRYGIAAIVGTSFGVTVPMTIRTSILDQALDTSKLPLVGVPFAEVISNLLSIIFVITCTFYFVYTFYGKKKSSKSAMDSVLDNIVKIGRYGLMLAFGTMLGNMVMDRFSSAIVQITSLVRLFIP